MSKCEHYVRYEDSIILKHCGDDGVVDVLAAQKELKDNGYDRTYHGLVGHIQALRYRNMLPDKIDSRGGVIPVMCIETQRRYPSMAEAARDNGLKGTYSIRRCCDNQHRRAAGMHWQYI